MFWEVKLNTQVRIRPNNLTKGIKDTIHHHLENNIKGRIYQNAGIVLQIDKDKTRQISRGMVSSRSGETIYEVEFSAISFKVFSGQVIDARVASISSQGIFAQAGLVEIFIDASLVSGFEYQHETSSLISIKSGSKIIKDSTIRCKMLSVRPKADLKLYSATGTMEDSFLGLIK